MVGSELEMLRESEEAELGARTPFESSLQAGYEDSVVAKLEWDEDDLD